MPSSPPVKIALPSFVKDPTYRTIVAGRGIESREKDIRRTQRERRKMDELMGEVVKK